MEIPNMFQPALDKISSIASTAKYGIIRFTGSFNDRTSLLLDDAELGPAQAGEERAAPPPQAQEAALPAPATAVALAHTFDIEAAAALGPSAAQGQGQDEEPADQAAESKRVAKSVQTVCLFAASASLVLFVNLPGRDDVPSKPATGGGKHGPGGALYGADLAFISLGFFSSLGLSMFSIVARPGEAAAVAPVQKCGMLVAVASVLVAFTLRMCMTLPAASP